MCWSTRELPPLVDDPPFDEPDEEDALLADVDVLVPEDVDEALAPDDDANELVAEVPEDEDAELDASESPPLELPVVHACSARVAASRVPATGWRRPSGIRLCGLQHVGAVRLVWVSVVGGRADCLVMKGPCVGL